MSMSAVIVIRRVRTQLPMRHILQKVEVECAYPPCGSTLRCFRSPHQWASWRCCEAVSVSTPVFLTVPFSTGQSRANCPVFMALPQLWLPASFLHPEVSIGYCKSQHLSIYLWLWADLVLFPKQQRHLIFKKQPEFLVIFTCNFKFFFFFPFPRSPWAIN